MKNGTFEDFKELGNDVKDAYQYTVDAIEKATNILPKSSFGVKKLQKAYKYLLEAKSELENEMFNKLNIEGFSTGELLNVFYGGKDDEEEKEGMQK